MQRKNLFMKTMIAGSVLLACSQANAAGFQLNEFSAVGLGRAYSGEGAMGDTAASASRNPATMALMKKSELSLGAIYVDPNVDLDGHTASGSTLSHNNIADSEIVPNIHYVQPITENWWIGASATTNYGLATDFSKDYSAGSLAGKTDLLTTNLNLSTAWRMNEHLSFGVGFDAVYGRATIDRYAGDMFGGLLPASTRVAHLKGDTWGYGWNAGLLYEVDDNNRFGFTYRSEVKMKFKGDYSNDLPTVLGGLNGSTEPGRLNLTLPDVWEVSGWHKVAPKWAVHYSFSYTNWSSFSELKATSNQGDTLFQKDEKYKDAWRVALGATYDYDDNWTFRGGVAFDDSPVNPQYRSISIPDQDRVWVTAGASYHFTPDVSVDVGVAYMHGQKVNITETSATGKSYTFSSKGTAWLYGAGFNYRF